MIGAVIGSISAILILIASASILYFNDNALRLITKYRVANFIFDIHPLLIYLLVGGIGAYIGNLIY